MTTESVATETTKTKSLPGLEDLLKPYSSHANPARAAQAASNALEPINPGIAAIGHLLWCASQAKDIEIDPIALGNLGLLLGHLTEFSDHVGFIERNADFIAHDVRNRK